MAKRGENIYKRKDGRWEARAIKGYNEHGKAVYAYFYGRTYKEAKDKMFMSLPYVDGSPMPTLQNSEDAQENAIFFGELLDKWLECSKLRVKESSYVKYHNLVNKHIKPSLGDFALPNINSTTVNRFVVDKLSDKDGIANGLSVKTVKDLISVIKSALRFGKDEGLISDFNINVTLPKDKPNNMRVLSTDEQTALEKFLCADMDCHATR